MAHFLLRENGIFDLYREQVMRTIIRNNHGLFGAFDLSMAGQ